MDISKIAQFLQSAKDDYSQLGDAYPNAQKFAQALKSNVEQHIPSNQDFQSPEKMNNFALAAALNAPMGLMFVGPKSTGWNHESANTATKLLNEGADPAQVWKEHLIGRMPDKSLFSEIDDSGAKLIPEKVSENKGIPAYIFDSFRHPELEKNYTINEPSFTNISDYFKSPHGSYNPEKGYGSGFIINAPNYRSGESITLHELQHAIQHQEGWAQGGSPEQMREEALAMLRRDVASGEIGSIAQAMDMLPMAQNNAYRRLTGEAQARATQDRMNLNMQQRRESYPLAGDKLSDIPLKDLISRYK